MRKRCSCGKTPPPSRRCGKAPRGGSPHEKSFSYGKDPSPSPMMGHGIPHLQKDKTNIFLRPTRCGYPPPPRGGPYYKKHVFPVVRTLSGGLHPLGCLYQKKNVFLVVRTTPGRHNRTRWLGLTTGKTLGSGRPCPKGGLYHMESVFLAVITSLGGLTAQGERGGGVVQEENFFLVVRTSPGSQEAIRDCVDHRKSVFHVVPPLPPIRCGKAPHRKKFFM